MARLEQDRDVGSVDFDGAGEGDFADVGVVLADVKGEAAEIERLGVFYVGWRLEVHCVRLGGHFAKGWWEGGGERGDRNELQE